MIQTQSNERSTFVFTVRTTSAQSNDGKQGILVEESPLLSLSETVRASGYRLTDGGNLSVPLHDRYEQGKNEDDCCEHDEEPRMVAPTKGVAALHDVNRRGLFRSRKKTAKKNVGNG